MNPRLNPRLLRRAVIVGLIAWLGAGAAQAAGELTCPANAEAGIVAVMVKMYEAARVDDLATIKSITTNDAYAFDGGKRFSFESLMTLIRDLHASGMRIEWQVTDPEVHVQCDHAWITYLNRGAIEKDSVRTPVEWLESAQLDYLDGHWLIRFFHSTRAETK